MLESPMMMAGLAAVALAAVVYAVIYPYVSGDRQKDKRISNVIDARARRAGAAASEAMNSRKKNVADTLKEMENRQKSREKITMRLRLQRAGLDISVRDFYLISAGAAVVICGVVFAFLSIPLPGYIAIAFVSGLGLPRFVLGKLIARRQKQFVAELANAIDIIVRGVKSGLPLNECIQVVARESPEPLSGEFREVVEQQRLGVTLGDCLERMCERMPIAEVRFLTIVIAIQQQAGGNLSEALGNLSGVLRDRFMLAMKVKALSAEAKASAAVLASLPPGVMGMVYMTSPDYIMPLFATPQGNFMLLFGGVWMLTGIMIMRKMINFKF
ncbi:MAG: type II secretion system F family protein [Hyphomicrobium sp.]